MKERILQIINDESVFLFGARQTGKTTLLKKKYPNAIYFDLLQTDVLDRLRRRPALLRESLAHEKEGTLAGCLWRNRWLCRASDRASMLANPMERMPA